MTTVLMSLLRAFWKPAAIVLALLAAYAYVHHLQSAADSAKRAEQVAVARVKVLESRVELDAAVAPITQGLDHEFAQIASVPIVVTRLRGLCSKPATGVRATDAATVEQPDPYGATDVGSLDDLAPILAQCRADIATLNAHVQFLDQIYAANPQ